MPDGAARFRRRWITGRGRLGTSSIGGVGLASRCALRISSSDVFFNDTRFSVTGRPYVHFADANEEIDHNSGTEQADEYGGGTGVNI